MAAFNQGEGHFAAKLTSQAEAAPVKRRKKAKETTESIGCSDSKLWQAFRKEFPFLQALNATPQLLGEKPLARS